MSEKKKLKFKMPHLLFMMTILIIVMSALTYILPTGEYVDVNGVNTYTPCERTPISIVSALLLIFDGVQNSSTVISLLLLMGGCMQIILGTDAIARLVDYAMYKLQDKGYMALIPCVFLIIAFVGGMAVEGAVALFPLGFIVARKLKLDPLSAAGITMLPAMVGWASSPLSCYVAQLMMGIPMYSGFGVRAINWLLSCAIGIAFVLLYSRKVMKDPTKSAIGNTDWLEEYKKNPEEIKESPLYTKDVLIILIFLAQFALYLYLMLECGYGLGVLVAVMFPAAIVCGLLNKNTFDEMGKNFEKGAKDMAFLCVIIGMAGTISLIMKQGKIVGTITYYLSLPLQGLSAGGATIGIAAVVALINIFVPSASAKAAALIPVIKPLSEALNISPQLAVQAFQVGDGFMNNLSPFNSVTLVGIAMANISFAKWAKWSGKLIAIYYVVEFIFLFILGSIGWA